MTATTMSRSRRAELITLLAEGPPRVGLLLGPTPLHPAPRLSERTGIEILFKRDDLTGLGFGGNKLRALDYLLADARRQGCDSVVTGAGPQSNWSTLAALTSLRCGLEPHIVSYGRARPASGNLLLQQRLGVPVEFTGDDDKESVDRAIDATAERLRAGGGRPYVIARGGATALGSLGYVRACLEMCWQVEELGISPRAVWLATGSCGTHAGLVAGRELLQATYDVTGVTVSRPGVECRQRISTLAGDAGRLLGFDTGELGIAVLDGWIGPGYGRPSPAGEAATDLVAVTEGVFLDPVFGAKAMAALVAACAAGTVRGPVIFLVTGGGPTLFATEMAPS